MAKIVTKPVIELQLTFTINEQEARALDGLAGYGADKFIAAFYEKLGRAYMQDHENGLREFLTSIRNIVAPAISNLDNARRAIQQQTNQ